MIGSVQSQHLYLQQKNKLVSDMLYKFYDEGELTEVDTKMLIMSKRCYNFRQTDGNEKLEVI